MCKLFFLTHINCQNFCVFGNAIGKKSENYKKNYKKGDKFLKTVLSVKLKTLENVNVKFVFP